MSKSRTAYMTAGRFNFWNEFNLFQGGYEDATIGNLPVIVVSEVRMPVGVDCLVLEDEVAQQLDKKYPDLRSYFTEVSVDG